MKDDDLEDGTPHLMVGDADAGKRDKKIWASVLIVLVVAVVIAFFAIG